MCEVDLETRYKRSMRRASFQRECGGRKSWPLTRRDGKPVGPLAWMELTKQDLYLEYDSGVQIAIDINTQQIELRGTNILTFRELKQLVHELRSFGELE